MRGIYPEEIDPMHFIRAGGHRLEYRWIQAAPAAPVLVFLHEGLGSVALWKRFPDAVADATGCSALVYSRYGYGKSDPLTEPRAVDYMHREALEVLPELLDALSIRNPILIGHSDGASIALIHAGAGTRRRALAWSPWRRTCSWRMSPSPASRPPRSPSRPPTSRPGSAATTTMSPLRSAAGTISGCIRTSAPGTSSLTSRASAVRCC